MTRRIKIRSFLIGGAFTLFFLLIIARIYWVQVVESPKLVSMAEKVWETDNILPAVRGAIYDRNDSVLAWNAPAYTVAVNPQLINQRGIAQQVVDGLAPILGMEDAAAYSKLQQLVSKQREDGSYYLHVEIRNEGWKIDSDVAEQINEFKEQNDIKGLYLLPEQKRYYPNNESAAQLIGYTDKDGVAIMGIEATMDDLLKGTDGFIHYEKDRLGYELPGSKAAYTAPIDGKSIRLTIDRNIQNYMDTTLQKVYETYEPISVTAIAADPKTMEILGMVNYPNFNPNEYWDFDTQADFFNHAVSSVYEPGSTFKIVTLASAVEEGLFDPEEEYQSGRITVTGIPINDYNSGIGWGKITFLEGLIRSSNVAFVMLGQQLGVEKQRSYIEKFGFGEKTGIELIGEQKGNVRFNPAIPIEAATATFGQGLTVTAIQQIAAVGAIANDGKLLKPHLIKEIIDSNTNEVLEKFEPEFVRQVVSPDTAHKVSEYLERVVSDQLKGTGRSAYIEGLRVAAKTGTAQKVVDGKYSDSQYVASFIGFAPADDPQLVLILIVDSPKIESILSGSQVTGPAFREIMGQSLRYLGVKSEGNSLSNGESQISSLLPKLTMPKLTDLSIQSAQDKLDARGLEFDILGSGNSIVEQFPAAGAEIGSMQRVVLLTDAKEVVDIPNLQGLSLRDALELCTFLGIEVHVEGEGYVISQQWQQSGGRRILSLRFEAPGG